MDKRNFKKIVRRESIKACSRIRIYGSILNMTQCGYKIYLRDMEYIYIVSIPSTITSHKIYSAIMNKVYTTTKYSFRYNRSLFIP